MSTEYYLTSKSPIGSGSSSQVFLGGKKQTESPVAIKTMQPKFYSEGEVYLHKLLLECPHLVHYRDDFRVNKENANLCKHCIVMDFANGSNIKEAYLNPSKLMPISDIKSVVVQTLEFLKTLALNNVIFFDLKPSNMIWLPEARTLKVVDLGSAYQVGSSYAPKSQVTAQYAPADYLLNKPSTSTFDLWSLGCTIYQLICGVPFINIDPVLSIHELFDALRTIVKRLGPPSREYLNQCEAANAYFDEDGNLTLSPAQQEYKPWREEFLAALDQRQVSEHEKGQWLQLMEQLLSYDNRGSAEEHLQNPLFQDETRFHLVYNTAIKCKMSIQRLGMVKERNIFVDFTKYKGNCFHIPKDAENKYLITLEKDGVFFKSEHTIFTDAALDITPLQNAIIEQIESRRVVKEEIIPTEEESSISPKKQPRSDEGDVNNWTPRKRKLQTKSENLSSIESDSNL